MFCYSRVKRFVAMKVVKSAEHYTETAVDEIKLLRSVSCRVNCTNELLNAKTAINVQQNFEVTCKNREKSAHRL